MGRLIVKLFVFVLSGFFLVACPAKKSQQASDTMYLELAAEPKTLDAFASRTDAYANDINGLIFDTLLSRDVDSYAWEPALAESYEVGPDALSYTFTLREGAVFSDGTPVTAEDVKFSFDTIFDDNYKAIDVRPYYESIKSVEVLDQRRVRFHVKQKYFRNLTFIGGGLWVVPKHIYSTQDPKHNLMSIGSGPWKIDNYKQGQSITLVKNDKWWGWDVPYYKNHYKIPKRHYRFIKDEKIRLESLKKGDLDFTSLSAEQIKTKTEGEPWGSTVFKQRVDNLIPKMTPFIGWNLKNDLFKSRKVRRALTHLYDRDMLAKKFFYDEALPATGPWYQQHPAADPDRKPLAFDPKLALELLRQEGWQDSDKNGVLEKTIDGQKKEFRFTLLNPNPDYEKYFTVYKEELKKAGIAMEITNLEWNAFQRKMDDHSFDSLFLVWSGTVEIDPKQVWHSNSAVKGGSNFIGYKNSEVDQLIDKARLELDRTKRHKMLRRVYNLIADDAPYVFLINLKSSFYGYSGRMDRPKPFYNYSFGTEFWSVKAKM